MARLSPISSTLAAYAAPKLTPAQQSAMSALFEGHLGRTVKNWNLFPATHPIWKYCISILIAELQRSVSLSAAEGGFGKRVVEVLTQCANQGYVKRFFCEFL